MTGRILVFVVVLLMVALAVSAGAQDFVMGNYEGKLKGKDGSERDITAKVIADGGNAYHAILTIPRDGGAEEVLVQGKRDGEVTTFADEGGKVRGRIQSGVFNGECELGAFLMRRVLKRSPTLGARPPEGAIVLFDGTNLDEWTFAEGLKPDWKLIDGAMEVVSGWVPSPTNPKRRIRRNLFTKRKFRDVFLHIEFCCPFMPERRNQARGNSGVFLPCGAEIQVLDSFGKKPAKNECGAIYGEAAPRVNASLPPLEWQTYDVEFTAPRYDENKKLIKRARVTVRHNGILIHDDFEIQKRNRAEGSIMLQDHGCPVRYRNIWVVPRE